MKAVLAGLGTTGDFEPMLALAVGLKRRGHAPVLASSPDFAIRANRHGIPFVEIGPPVAELGIMRCLQEILELANPIEQAAAMIACVVPFVPRMVEELDRASSDADMIVCLPFQVAGFLSHERTGVPFVAWNFSPFGAVPGRQFREATDEMINRARRQIGRRPVAGAFAEATARSRLTLFAASGHVFRRPRDWPPHYHLTGYFTLDDSFEPDPALLRFLESGPAPVVVTFGSMRHPDPAAVSRIVFDAVDKVGCRAVVQDGWSGLAEVTRSPRVFVTRGFTPHHWLFPRACCIVHHGAAGTTAAALRAGVPSVIVPHALDQPVWAALMHAFGAAPSVIPLQQLTAERLAGALGGALRFDGGERLERLAARIRAENGVERAIALMEATLG